MLNLHSQTFCVTNLRYIYSKLILYSLLFILSIDNWDFPLITGTWDKVHTIVQTNLFATKRWVIHLYFEACFRVWSMHPFHTEKQLCIFEDVCNGMVMLHFLLMAMSMPFWSRFRWFRWFCRFVWFWETVIWRVTWWAGKLIRILFSSFLCAILARRTPYEWNASDDITFNLQPAPPQPTFMFINMK